MIGVGTAGQTASHTPAEGAETTLRSDLPVAGATPASPADPYAAERDAWAILAAVGGLGPVAFGALLHRYTTARDILAAAAGPGAVERLTATPTPVHEPDRDERRPVPPGLATAIVEAVARGDVVPRRLRELGLRVVTMDEPAYPPRLLGIAMPPHVLFVQGPPAALTPARAVAIVGTRGATGYGRLTTRRLVAALIAADATVVSGLAYGIDGVAHEATLAHGGATVAVIGGGHATGIPPAHGGLAEAIVASGGAIVSEYAPDTLPTRGTFPRRNRVISGLAGATVVVEAPARSGALITASWAVEQGRPCFLVPGPIDAPSSAGCLAFLREYPVEAHIVAGIPQLIADLGLAAPPSAEVGDAVASASLATLGDAAHRIAAVLVAGPATVDELVAQSDLPVAAVLATLAVLEGRGLAVGLHGRYRAAGPLLQEPPARRTR